MVNIYEDLLSNGVRCGKQNFLQPRSENVSKEELEKAAAVDSLFILKGDSL